jgi:hypothetical protein
MLPHVSILTTTTGPSKPETTTHQEIFPFVQNYINKVKFKKIKLTI